MERVTRQNYGLFRAIYHADDETYWNADRIYESLEDWLIFIYRRDDRPIAAVFLMGKDGYYEIFGTEFDDGIFRDAVFRELVTAALNACKRMGAKYLTYFCDEKELLRALGFRCVGL